MKVSAIMPTRGRCEFAQKALQSFLNQRYDDKEMVILDDADDPSFLKGIDHPLVHYQVARQRWPIPVKRNQCCELATGEVIAHYDSDDWSAPERIADQVRLLEASGLQVVGYRQLFFWDEDSRRAFRYISPRSDRVAGTSLMYRKAWWQLYAFNASRHVNSDGEFQMWPRMKKQLAVADGLGQIVARVHATNFSAITAGSFWDCVRNGISMPAIQPVNKEELPQAFFQ